MNGPNTGKKYIDSIDVNSPDYRRNQFRPAEVKQDVRQMEERKRVNEILKSKQFRDELEDVVVDKIKSFTPDRASIIALQQMSELVLPMAKLRHGPVYGRNLNPIIPISDAAGAEDGLHRFEKGEKLLRNKLAACYRLIDQYKWSQQPQRPTYISGRLLSDPLTFLISPGDRPFHEATAMGLVAADGSGRTASGKGVDEVASVLHAAAYQAREDVRSVMLIRSSTAVALASAGSELLPLSCDAILLGRVPSVELNEAEDVVDQLAAAFKTAKKAILVKGIGALVVGESVEGAFISGCKLVGAMETQLRVIHVGVENLHIPSEEVQRMMFETTSKRERKEESEFESLMRQLENAGHCTGYLFKESLFRKVEKSDKVNSEVELPPTVVSLGYQDDDRPRERKPLSYAEYLNSPNSYKKEELETASGKPYNKKITKWVQESIPAGNLIKIDSPNQFAPVGTDPKELKDTMKKICREYYDENITAGPQSKILGGLTWEEAQKIRDKNVSSDTVIMVGAASRGIVQKDHRGVQGEIYRTYYAPNPFANVTDEEVDAYKSKVGLRNGGGGGAGRVAGGAGDSAHIVNYGEDPESLVPGPDGRLISTEERIKQVKQQQQQQPEEVVVSDGGEEEEEAIKKKQQAQQMQHGQQPQQHPIASNDVKPASSVPKHVMKGQQGPASPAKSLSSGDGTAPEATSGTEKSEFESSGVDEKKKKKKGFRMPSFSKKKDKK